MQGLFAMRRTALVRFVEVLTKYILGSLGIR